VSAASGRAPGFRGRRPASGVPKDGGRGKGRRGPPRGAGTCRAVQRTLEIRATRVSQHCLDGRCVRRAGRIRRKGEGLARCEHACHRE